MTKVRKLELVEKITEVLKVSKMFWNDNIADIELRNNFSEFRSAILGMGGVYYDSIDLTDDERKMINADGSASSDLEIVLEIVLGQMWLEW